MELRLTGCAVDLERGLVRTDTGDERGLTTLEAALLRYLAARPGVDVGRDELAREVWRGVGAGRAVDFTVRRLRAKLGEPRRPLHVLTSHGTGYRFVPLAGPIVVAPPVEEVVVALATGELSLGRRRFVREGQSHALTHLEARVLEELVPSLGRPVPRATLIARVWGRGRHDHTLDATIARLRAKLEPDPAAPIALVTARGEGPCLLGAAPGRVSRAPPVASAFLDRPELAVARVALTEPGLVTLVGTAGIGKTRLALQLAAGWTTDRRGGEVWFCDLTRVGHADSFVARVAATLGADPTADRDRVGRLLADRPEGTLVVLDNLEQLVDCADLVVGWVRAAPGLRLLGTSRVPLGVPGERTVDVQPLARSTGIALFRARTGPAAAADDDAVGALVDRLDGLPLAIELAAALGDRMSPEALLERLGARLDLLVLRPEGATSQHSTLRGAIDWSWHLLDPDQQEVLAGCAVFAGGFDADDASAVVGRDATAALAALVARSLVVPDAGAHRLLAAIRAYAHERLVLSGALATAVERHADRMLVRAEPIAAHLDDHWGAESAAQLAELREDLVAALDRTSRPDARGRLARVVGARGVSDHTDATHARLSAALSRGVGPHGWAILLMMSTCSIACGWYDRGAAEVDRAQAEGDAGDGLATARIELERYRGALSARDLPRAFLQRDVVAEVLRALPPSEGRLRAKAEFAALALHTYGLQCLLDPWGPALTEAKALAAEVGDPHLVALTRRSEARLRMYLGDWDAASAAADRVIEAGVEYGRPVDALYGWELRGNVAYHAGWFARVEEAAAAIEAIARETGADPSSAAILRACVALERGDLAAVDALLPESRLLTQIEMTAPTRCAALLWEGRGHEALAVLDAVAYTNLHWLLRAAALATVGRIDEAVSWVDRMCAASDPRIAGLLREVELTRAWIALEAARGTPAEPAARAAAEKVLRAGVLVECDDGVLRERPGDVAVSRALVERSLVRT